MAGWRLPEMVEVAEQRDDVLLEFDKEDDSLSPGEQAELERVASRVGDDDGGDSGDSDDDDGSDDSDNDDAGADLVEPVGRAASSREVCMID